MEQQLKQITSIRQKHPPAVPFLWEQRPGTPKQNWKPDTTAIPTPHSPLIKLIASVPFEWEELPGKPLSCFSHPHPQPPENIEQQILSVLALPPPPTSTLLPNCSEDIIPLLSEDSDYNGNYYELLLLQSENELESTFCSNKYPTVEPEHAASYNNNNGSTVTPILVQEDGNSSPPSSPESESEEDGNCAAEGGAASLVGVSFLERLFPLLLRQNAAGTSNNAITKPQEEKEDRESKASSTVVAARRAHTLGELIMMSRRISRKRKAIQFQKQGLSIMDQVVEKSDMICMGGCMSGVIDKIGGGGGINWNWNGNMNMKKNTHFHRLKFM